MSAPHNTGLSTPPPAADPAPATGTAGLDQQTFAIGLLSITACILFAALVVLLQTPAQANNVNDRSGDYIMLTHQISSNQDGVMVIDAAAKQMIIYRFDYNRRNLEPLVTPVPLEQMPSPRKETPPPAPPTRPRR